MGVAVVGKMALTGRVLGISGACKGFLDKDFSPWRFTFLGGMALGALGTSVMMPGAIVDVPKSFTFARGVLGAFLVGLGSALGNGCTSGHGISGNARLAKRSMVYTCVFMAAGVVMATATGTVSSLGVTGAAKFIAPSADDVSFGLGLLGAATAGMAACGAANVALGEAHAETVGTVVDGVAGATFGAALVSSGMVRHAKVAAFLDMLAPTRDFSLMFVMGGALAVATPAVQLLLAKRDEPRLTKLRSGKDLQVPCNTQLDKQLIAGGVLFGAGWGVCGSCPGPMLVNLVANANAMSAIMVGAMMLGMAAAVPVKPLFASEKCNKSS